jgi:hypothetical protein
MSTGVGGERLLPLKLGKKREARAHAASKAAPNAINDEP